MGYCARYHRRLTGKSLQTSTKIESWAIKDDLPLRRLTLPKQHEFAGGNGTASHRPLSLRQGQARSFLLTFPSQFYILQRYLLDRYRVVAVPLQ